jgi:hypothetical protein
MARKTLREQESGRLSKQDLSQLHVEIKDAEALLQTTLEGSADPCENFPVRSSYQPFDGFGLLVDSVQGFEEQTRSDLGGPPAIAEPSPFVDFARAQDRTACSGETGNTIEGLLETIKGLLSVADKIDALQCCDLNSKRQILSLCEDFLTGSAGHCLLPGDSGNRGSATRTVQSSLLSAWEALSRHYLAAALSVPTGKEGYGRRVITYGALLMQMDLTLRLDSSSSIEGSSPLSEEVRTRKRPLWPAGLLSVCSGHLSAGWQSGCRFDDLTNNLPLGCVDFLGTRRRITGHFAGDAVAAFCCSGDERKAELIFKNAESFPGLDAVQLCGRLRAAAVTDSSMSATEMPALLAVANLGREPKDFELGILWTFDEKLDSVHPEWKHCRDTFLRFQLLLGMVQPRIAGEEVPACREDGVVRASETALLYKPTFYDTMGGFADTLAIHIHLVGGGTARLCANKPHSQCDPTRLLLSHDIKPSGGVDVTENDVLAAEILPDFNHTMTQTNAEELYLILTAPSVRIPLILHFFIPDRIFLLCNQQLQDILFASLFEPSHLSELQGPTAERVKQAPCQKKQLGTPRGLLLHELEMAPAAVLAPLVQLLLAMPELSDCDVGGLFVQPFCFVLHVSVLVQGVLLQAIQETREGRAHREELAAFEVHFRRFNQGYARTRIMHWLEQALTQCHYAAAAKLLAHLCITSLPLLTLSVADLQSLVSSAALFWTWHRADASRFEPLGSHSGGLWVTPADIVEWVVSCLHKHRLSVLEFLADQHQRDRILSYTLLQAVGCKAVGFAAADALLASHPALTWQAIEQDLDHFICVVDETQHPFTESDLAERSVTIPGAKMLTIRFDEQSNLGRLVSLEIRVKRSGTEVVWKKTDTNQWPGVGGAPPLVLSGCCSFSVHINDQWGKSNHRANPLRAWGFKLTAEAPLSQKKAS